MHVPALPQANALWAVTCLHRHNTSHEKVARVNDLYSSSRPSALSSLPASMRVHSMTLHHRETWCSRRSFCRDTCSLGVNPFANSFRGVVHIVIGRVTIVTVDSVIFNHV